MKYMLLVVVFIAAGVVGYAIFEKQAPAENKVTTPLVTDVQQENQTETETEIVPVSEVTANPTPSPATETKPAVKTFTMAEVALHADATSCYSVVNGSVYDLTNWITKHPGGQQAIKGLCGKDGTAAFTGKHGGDTRPETVLATFKIGLLTQ